MITALQGFGTHQSYKTNSNDRVNSSSLNPRIDLKPNDNKQMAHPSFNGLWAPIAGLVGLGAAAGLAWWLLPLIAS